MARVALEVVTPPTLEPVSIEDLRAHVRGSTEDNELIESYAVAAREHVETRTQRVLLKTTLRAHYPGWPMRSFELPRGPLTSSTSIAITYRKEGSTSWTALSSTKFVVNTALEPAVLTLRNGHTYPDASLEDGWSVRVQFDAGSTDVEGVPARAKQVIRLLTGDAYENRESIVVGAMAPEASATRKAAENLMWSLAL